MVPPGARAKNAAAAQHTQTTGRGRTQGKALQRVRAAKAAQAAPGTGGWGLATTSGGVGPKGPPPRERAGVPQVRAGALIALSNRSTSAFFSHPAIILLAQPSRQPPSKRAPQYAC